MLEITSKNCYKCDLETIIDNNSQHFWINLRDLEVETESKWLNIFNKHGNKSTLKYRREIAPDIKAQADKIFVRNDLFEQVIKSCKATNIEFTMLKKLGICLYEENYYTEEIIQIQDNTLKPSIKEINEVSNKVSTKKLTTKLTKKADNKSIEVIDQVLINESDNKSINELDNSSINELDNKSINKEVNSNLTNWYDTDKFNKILATIDNNNFNHKNKIGKLKFNEINDLINSIKSNTISEADAKKKLNELNKIKKVETNGKRLIDSQNKLLSFFDDLLKTIFKKTVNEGNSNTKNESKSDNESDYGSDNESDNGNKNESVNENKNESENESENENESDDGQYYLKQLNNNFNDINKIKSFKDQKDALKKISDLGNFWHMHYYEDNKE